MRNEEYKEKLEAITDNLVTTIMNKTEGYGGSVYTFGDKGIIIRLHDKLQRLTNLLSKQGEDRVGESIDDTALDLLGYSLLLVFSRTHPDKTQELIMQSALDRMEIL